ncbi:aminoglycoside phosphotransferase family protein [Acidicapsa dinghuensis]|uniref:Aminoglycoside phosphotransferase family protein n=1 Tax=Acidicapsa dinghuensis TaxID=2218256 RepID=A0ABW1EDL0_9BACT|nr:aminoglycoside phosphotransferase family protein [Acidicapsa dinghuensis]
MTAELTRRFPQYLPKTLATIPEWNGWLMQGVQGVPLNESNDVRQCEQALAALATMQKELAVDTCSWSILGAKDWTCQRIASLLELFFEDAQQAMLAQEVTIPKPLTCVELESLQDDVRSALQELTSAGIPETLVHGDIGHGNVIAAPGGPVFLDWAETYIGHPFMSAEHLLADLARSSPLVADSHSALRRFYADYWRMHTATALLEKTISVAPSIAAFLYGLVAWAANRNRPDPTLAWPLLRSMLRRTKWELAKASEVAA